MEEFLSTIRSAPLFSGVSEAELTAMLACLKAEKKDFPKEAFVLRAGDTAESIGLVLTGTVLVIQEDIWGNRNILSKAGLGQTFAAAYACAPGSRLNVSVVAETPVTVLFLNVKRILTATFWGNWPGKICSSVKNSPMWASAAPGRRSCPTCPPRHSGWGPTSWTFPFPGSSWRITWAWSAAVCHRNWGK